MNENRYALAGWLSIANAAIFPLGFAVAFFQAIITKRMFGPHTVTLGPGDLLFIISTGIAVYILIMFKDLLNKRYNYHDIDTLIAVSIWWNVVFQIISLIFGSIGMVMGPKYSMGLTLLMLAFFPIYMIVMGIVDIMIATRLLKIKESLNDIFKVFIYVTLIAGILEVSVLLSPLALILVPVSCVVLGMIFLREKEEVEFV
jgi:hypothetical protein